jgi:uncharacterized protein YoaH (UPF0181 family)
VRNKTASPSPSALIESMRNLGYDLPSALADIIDNSITAEANEIHIDYGWNEGRPYVLITDNGNGMSEDKLFEAMTPGATSPLEERELHDLGRFGLGLKTASWSQSKRMTAYTKHEGSIHHLTWDLDHVSEVDEWELLGGLEEYEVNILNEKLNSYDSGTAILWTNLDRILPEKGNDETKKEILYSTMNELVMPHLSMIFHRYLEGKGKIIKIKIFVGRAACSPWDPFMSTHSATEERSGEMYKDERIIITPYILPHSSKLTSALEKEEAEGVRGWDANQGFFVYRRNRMIISGGYFDLDLKSNASYRLCRIKVDLTNEFDLEWKVDVRKKDVIPPPGYREHLKRIAKSTMRDSSKRYVARTTSKTRLRKNQTLDEVWQRKQIGEKIQYKINSNSPGIQAIIDQHNPDKKFLKQLLYIIERTIPYRSITLDNNEMEDATMNLPQENIKPPDGFHQVAVNLINSHMNDGMSAYEAIELVTQQILPSFGAEFRVSLEDKFKGEL